MKIHISAIALFKKLCYILKSYVSLQNNSVYGGFSVKRSIAIRFIALVLMCVMCVGMLTGCVTMGERKPSATILFSNGTEITVRLYPDKAPNTVNNFISLANAGFYDGSPVHRIVEYSLVQMGKPADSEESDAGYYIKGEFPNNGYVKNDMLHKKGVLSMARTVDPNDTKSKDYYDTASSQFFICVDNEVTLDGDYAAFGKIIFGYDEFEKISKMDVDANKAPRDEIYIESVTIELHDYTPKEPKTIEKPAAE